MFIQYRVVFEYDTTLSQEWSGNSIRGPQCAFEMSMFMCPAVHKLTRNLLRSSSTHEPSDPPFRVIFKKLHSNCIWITFLNNIRIRWLKENIFFFFFWYFYGIAWLSNKKGIATQITHIFFCHLYTIYVYIQNDKYTFEFYI